MSKILIQRVIEVAQNPANLITIGELLPTLDQNPSNVFRGIENLRGEKSAGDVKNYEYNRHEDRDSFVVQGTTEGNNTETTVVSDGIRSSITVHSTIDSLTKPIHVNQQSDAYETDSMGRRVAMTPEMLLVKFIYRMRASRIRSQEQNLWYILKHGFLPNGKDWATNLVGGITTAPAIWNNYDYLKLWEVERPAGVKYLLANGFTNVDFSKDGAVLAFTENAQESLDMKSQELGTSISIGEGALVLLGKKSWLSFINSPDLKKLAIMTNPQFTALAKIDILGTQVQKVEINGVTFQRKNWNDKMEYQGNVITFKQMEDLEILVLPNVDRTIVDKIVFDAQDILSSKIGWGAGSPEIIWEKIADDRTKIDLGLRGAVGYGNSMPELAILGTHVAIV